MSTRLPTIGEVLTLGEPTLGCQSGGDDTTQAEQKWRAAIAALSQLLQDSASSQLGSSSAQTCVSPHTYGIMLAGPAPVLSAANLISAFSTWIFTTSPPATTALQLPAQTQAQPVQAQDTQVVPLLSGDPLTAEQFCLVLTADFSLVVVLVQTSTGQSDFLYSFAPEVVQQAWLALRLRVLLGDQADQLDTIAQHFTPTEPHYTTVMQFSRLLLKFLAMLPQRSPQLSAEVTPDCSQAANPTKSPSDVAFQAGTLPEPVVLSRSRTQAAQTNHARSNQSQDQPQALLSDFEASSDIELLQAIAHEVRTPLATISTLTRLLLKRPDLPAEVVKRLEAIYRECSEQIDRFSLIFRAAELETTQRRQQWSPTRQKTPSGSPPVQLTSVSLAQVLQQSIPRWQKQAARRNLKLQVSLPQQMPAVVSDPTVLDQVLTGLIDRFARSLPTGSHIHLQVALAGDQLKLQLQPQCNSAADEPETDIVTPVLKSVGQLLMLQPETGTLSLSLPVTKNLFQALGGKLTVRHRPQQGEVFTIFLPLGRESNAYQ